MKLKTRYQNIIRYLQKEVIQLQRYETKRLKKKAKDMFKDIEKELEYILAYHCNCDMNEKIDKNVLFMELKNKWCK